MPIMEGGNPLPLVWKRMARWQRGIGRMTFGDRRVFLCYRNLRKEIEMDHERRCSAIETKLLVYPGKYVAVCIHADGKSHYVKVFVFPKPEVREDPALGGFACPPGVDASWYYLNRVDPVGRVEAVHPVGIFKDLILGGWKEVPEGTMLASERAGKAAEEASKWHQGSGTHAGGCSAIAQHFEGLGNKEIAELWADAAEAEAAHLEKVGGKWFEYKDWLKSKSGKATDKATKATKLVDPKFEMNEWM